MFDINTVNTDTSVNGFAERLFNRLRELMDEGYLLVRTDGTIKLARVCGSVTVLDLLEEL